MLYKCFVFTGCLPWWFFRFSCRHVTWRFQVQIPASGCWSQKGKYNHLVEVDYSVSDLSSYRQTTSFPLWRKKHSILTTIIIYQEKKYLRISCFKAWNVPLDITRRHPKPSLKPKILGGACPWTPIELQLPSVAVRRKLRLRFDSNTRFGVRISIVWLQLFSEPKTLDGSIFTWSQCLSMHVAEHNCVV